MESQTPSSQERKNIFESLSREELEKKCRNLLAFSKQTKKDKDELAAENKNLGEELANYKSQKSSDKDCLRTMQEMVDSLTEKKLQDATKIADLEKQIKKFEEQTNGFKIKLQKFDDVSVENESLKRQLDRLSNENDSLLSDMDKLEKDYQDLRKSIADKNATVIDTQKLDSDLKEMTKNYEDKVQELKSLQIIHNDLSEKNSSKIKKMIQENSDLKSRLDELQKSDNSSDLQLKYEKLVRKLKLYKEKVLEVSGKLKVIKNDRDVLYVTAKEYSDNIPKWQKQLSNVSQLLIDNVVKYEKEVKNLNVTLKEKDQEIAKLKSELSSLESNNESSELRHDKISSLEMEMERLTKNEEELNKKYQENCDNLKESDAKLADLLSQLSIKDTTIEELERNLKDSREQLQENINIQSQENQNLDNFKKYMKTCEDEIKCLRQLESDLKEKINSLEQEKVEFLSKMESSSADAFEAAGKLEYSEKERQILKEECESLGRKLVDHEKVLQSEKILKEEIEMYRKQVFDLEESNQKLQLYKKENGELLVELKDINENLKERGEIISNQEIKIIDLETRFSDAENNMQINAQKLREKEEKMVETEEKLVRAEEQLTAMREKYNYSFELTSTDTMSTSTISKADEASRLKEVDDDWEDKYNKVKAVAMKYKKKVAEQQVIITKLESSAPATPPPTKNKNFMALQQEIDKLQDKIDLMEKQKKDFVKEKQSLEIITKDYQSQIEALKTEGDSSQKLMQENKKLKEKVDSLEKQVKDLEKESQKSNEYLTELQNLKEEKESFNQQKQQLASEILQLNTTIQSKEKSLNEEIEKYKQLKAEFDKLKTVAKKSNVLSLEMDAYEKSALELTKKLDAKNTQIAELEATIQTQNETMQTLNDSIRELQEIVEEEKKTAMDSSLQMEKHQTRLREVESDRSDLKSHLDTLTDSYETLKMQKDDLQLGLSSSLSEKDKLCVLLEADKSNLLKQVMNLENELDATKTSLKEYEKEVEDLKTEFAAYKIRAQSVLRQNTKRDTGKEQELQEEIQSLQKNVENLNEKLKKLTKENESFVKSHSELVEDKTRLQKRCKELLDLIEESRLQNEQVLEESKKRNEEHQESIKTYQLQVDALNNCYKKQIQEIQEKYSEEVLELTEKLKAKERPPSLQIMPRQSSPGPPTPTEQKISMILMEREEGEGSENTSSSIANSYHQRRKISQRRDLVPLDELLNSSIDDNYNSILEDRKHSVSPTLELEQTKDKLIKEESKVKHLSQLLAETEQDLAKFQQLNEVLKEEVRRIQRSIDREEHVQNSEYLKNVIYKFVTLQASDERLRLVPVLNTILKLSPEETQKLTAISKPGFLGIW